MPTVSRPGATQPPANQPGATQPTPGQPAPTQEVPVVHSIRRHDESDEMLTRFDLQRPATTGPKRAPNTADLKRAAAERARREEAYKPFFTQVGTAVTNRQHNRVIMVVPLLLIVSLLLFLFAYIASK